MGYGTFLTKCSLYLKEVSEPYMKDQHAQDAFYTNISVIRDFKDYVRALLNHVNPLTGMGRNFVFIGTFHFLTFENCAIFC